MQYPNFNYTTNPTSAPEQEILPQLVPSSATDVITQDIHVTEMIFSNVTINPVTVTVQDRQATPMILLPAVSVPANSTMGIPLRGRWMPGGLTWSASAANAIVGSIRGY